MWFDVLVVIMKYVCEVFLGDGFDGIFNFDDWMELKECCKVDYFIFYGIVVVQMVVIDVGWMFEDEESCLCIGVMIGLGIGGLNFIVEIVVMIKECGLWCVFLFFISGVLINLIFGQVLICFGFKGLNYLVVMVCFMGVYVIGDVLCLIKNGDVDVMIVGGVEVVICEIGIVGFNVCKVLFIKCVDDL